MNLEERSAKFEKLMSDLTAFLVTEYGLESREAAGLVMDSAITQQIYDSDEDISRLDIKELAKRYII